METNAFLWCEETVPVDLKYFCFLLSLIHGSNLTTQYQLHLQKKWGLFHRQSLDYSPIYRVLSSLAQCRKIYVSI